MKFASLLLIGACVAPAPLAFAIDNAENVTVISARTSADYRRTSAAGGEFQPEHYAFAEGGRWNAELNDPSLDAMKFIDVARTVAVPLATQAYLPTRDPKETKLLIVVYWGRTNTGGNAMDPSTSLQDYQSLAAAATNAKSANDQQKFSATKIGSSGDAGNMVCGHIETNTTAQQVTDIISSQSALNGAMGVVAAQNAANEKSYEQNAAMLGYDALLGETNELQAPALAYRRQDAINELRRDRYFVVLMAYDFQMMWKEKKHKLLWETRLSLDQRGNEFNQQVSMMAKAAAQYFGKDTHGLVREDLPVGRVNVGAVKSLGYVAEK
ncbi:MAG TPA: hypothetical protein VFE25_11805 [Opitutaceae bacterium]|jgi:hypothetical protein|nr:hypothetical protein [Opitutaceae bacterium]